MNKNNGEERKCKICGKTIVGKNITGICSACKKKAGDFLYLFTGSYRRTFSQEWQYG